MKKTYTLVAATLVLGSTFAAWDEAGAIPPFARKYGTSCSTCHKMFPELNAFGEAFRLNGYQIPAPEGDEPYIKDEPLQLGAPAWKQLFPKAIWPGTIPGMPPIGMRVLSDIQYTKDETKDFDWNFEFPHELEPLFGGTFSDDIGFFGQLEYKHPDTLEILQAFVKFQDPLTNIGLPLPERAFNIWVGKFDQMQNYLPGYRNFTRVGKNHPLWGNKKLSDMKLTNPTTGTTLSFKNAFRPQTPQPAIEANGILFKRFGYGVGVAQGQGDSVFDMNKTKDIYYWARYKLWGRALDGSLPGKEVTVEAPATGGWVDNSISIEHFGYFGEFPVQQSPFQINDDFNRFGVAVRGTYENLDVAGGYSWGHHDNPWAPASFQGASYKSPFVKAEYMFFPWLMGFFRWEYLNVNRPTDLVASGFTVGGLKQQRFLPGVAFLIRANMKVVLEGEVYSENQAADTAGLDKPNNFWIRLDLAF
jgi:hypothetical protein